MSMQLEQGLAVSGWRVVDRSAEDGGTPSGPRFRSEADLDFELDPLLPPPDYQYDI